MHRTNDISGSTIWIRPRSGALSPKIRSVIWVASDESSRLCKVRRNCCAGSVDVVAFGSRYLFWADATPSKWAELNGLPPKDGLLGVRSEEHTSELQSLMRISYAVFCLKKKKTTHTIA